MVPAGHRAAGALELAVLPGLDDDLTFTEAALDLREAVGELEWLMNPSPPPPSS